MFNTVFVGAIATAAISIASVMAINTYIETETANQKPAIVQYHADVVNGMLKNQADVLCPALPTSPEYAAARQAAHCDRFGY
jgi:hypothetical protein